MKKRGISIVLAVFMVLALLGACGGGGSDTGSATTTAATTEAATTAAAATEAATTAAAAAESAGEAETTAAATEAATTAAATTAAATTAAATTEAAAAVSGAPFNDVRLTMLICWNGGYKVPDDQYNNPVAAKIREKLGVTVEFEGIMMSETEKLNLMFASGDMPDIVNAPFWGGYGGETGVIKKGANEGQLMPIEDILPKYPNVQRSYDIGVISQKYYETDLTDPMFNGHLYLIPQETPGNTAHITNWAYGIFVRGDVPGALGIDEKSIRTEDELYDFFIKARDFGFKDVNGNDTIVATTYHEGWDYGRYAEGWSSQKLTDYFDMGDGTVSYAALMPQWIERHMFIWKLVNENILDKECFKITDTQADQKVGNGTALFYAAQYGVGINATKQTGLYNAHPEMRYIPVGPLNDIDGNPLIQVESFGRTGSPVIFFPKNCSNIEAAFTYIDFVNTPEGRTYAGYGIEGQTYVLNDSGQPRLIPEYLERKRNGDSTWEDALREIGGKNYIDGRLWYGNLNVDWFGENGIGDADAAVQEVEAYKLVRPVKQLEGYALTAFEGDFDRIDDVRTAFFEGNPEKTYRERAYFETTEAGARAILEEWQNVLRTGEDGLFGDYLSFLAEKAKTRADIAY